MKKITSIFIILYIILIQMNLVYSESLPNFNVTSYILIDKNSGQVLCERDSAKKIYPASTTKILTAAVSLENTPLNKEYIVTKSAIDAIGVDGMSINLKIGEKLNLDNLLHAMLLSSANEAAYVIAEGSLDNYNLFLQKMNSKAKEIGAINSNFVNPNGMFNANHYSTASDMAKIAQYAMKNETFRNIVSQTSYNLPPTNMHPTWPKMPILNNFVVDNPKSEYYTKITGIKTGFIDESKRNLVGSAIDSKGLELISVVIGANTIKERDQYSKELLEYGYKNFSIQKVITKGSPIKNSLDVKESKDNIKLNLVCDKDIEALLPNDKNIWKIDTIENLNIKDIKAPVSIGQNFGTIEYKNGDQSLGKINVIAANSIEKIPPTIIPIKSVFDSNIMLYFNIVIIFIGAIFIVRIVKKVIILK